MSLKSAFEMKKGVRPWIKEFMNYYLKGVFSNFDWEIQLSNIRGGSLSKTRKKQNKSEKNIIVQTVSIEIRII
jgi:hypothetical protein